MTRRQALELLSWLGLGATWMAACGRSDPAPADGRDSTGLPFELPDVDPFTAADNVRAAFDVLLPAERDGSGRVVSPGAVEAGAFELLELDRFLPLARAQGLLPVLPPGLADAASGLNPALVGLLSVELDAMAAEVRPLTYFKDLSLDEKKRAVALAVDTPERRPVIRFLRSVGLLAFLGAVINDDGLRALGYPPFESFDEGIANSGYPRTTSGRRVDPEREDLDALAAAGDLDDYTYREAPSPTEGDGLSTVIDSSGDLY